MSVGMEYIKMSEGEQQGFPGPWSLVLDSWSLAGLCLCVLGDWSVIAGLETLELSIPRRLNHVENPYFAKLKLTQGRSRPKPSHGSPETPKTVFLHLQKMKSSKHTFA